MHACWCLRKEYTIRMRANLWLVGCLSWEQFVKIHIMYWPHPPPLLVVAKEIARSSTQQGWQQPLGQQLQAGQQQQEKEEEEEGVQQEG